jgi:hypothetical protein
MPERMTSIFNFPVAVLVKHLAVRIDVGFELPTKPTRVRKLWILGMNFYVRQQTNSGGLLATVLGRGRNSELLGRHRDTAKARIPHGSLVFGTRSGCPGHS